MESLADSFFDLAFATTRRLLLVPAATRRALTLPFSHRSAHKFSYELFDSIPSLLHQK